MSPEVYKQKLKAFFTNLSREDSEATKLKKIDAFRRVRGVKRHLRTFVFAFLLFTSLVTPTFAAPPVTLIPDETYDGGEACQDLAMKFNSGHFELADIPCYAMYLTEFLIYIGGGIAVLFIVIGGYQYMIGSVTDDKDSGKKTIKYALAGFIIALLAWTIINVWQVWLTAGSSVGQ